VGKVGARNAHVAHGGGGGGGLKMQTSARASTPPASDDQEQPSELTENSEFSLGDGSATVSYTSHGNKPQRPPAPLHAHTQPLSLARAASTAGTRRERAGGCLGVPAAGSPESEAIEALDALASTTSGSLSMKVHEDSSQLRQVHAALNLRKLRDSVVIRRTAAKLKQANGEPNSREESASGIPLLPAFSVCLSILQCPFGLLQDNSDLAFECPSDPRAALRPAALFAQETVGRRQDSHAVAGKGGLLSAALLSASHRSSPLHANPMHYGEDCAASKPGRSHESKPPRSDESSLHTQSDDFSPTGHKCSLVCVCFDEISCICFDIISLSCMFKPLLKSFLTCSRDDLIRIPDTHRHSLDMWCDVL
jgi:hypothetical protein